MSLIRQEEKGRDSVLFPSYSVPGILLLKVDATFKQKSRVA